MIPKILNLAAVLGVKGNEAGGEADFIEQDSTAGPNLAQSSNLPCAGILLEFTFKKEAKICTHVNHKNKPFGKR